ncbi:hypothetical protein FA09DRAFT_338320 [Tilletiopsis washingtonensis]|uniref:BZIP domain-containing protein n=1 Tax=Tilletiopsis washingtonensis TaxID=58919 RepID=A0A316ZAY2_9BASI|nr:hypothetical protein FA09DRAFT_338320 [Tilletiopsis washingtonensis]PWN98456.1 hypothetical protein FA09DRAFT_338320 [Tilletiopsis washingtonensis]
MQRTATHGALLALLLPEPVHAPTLHISTSFEPVAQQVLLPTPTTLFASARVASRTTAARPIPLSASPLAAGERRPLRAATATAAVPGPAERAAQAERARQEERAAQHKRARKAAARVQRASAELGLHQKLQMDRELRTLEAWEGWRAAERRRRHRQDRHGCLWEGKIKESGWLHSALWNYRTEMKETEMNPVMKTVREETDLDLFFFGMGLSPPKTRKPRRSRPVRA